MSSPRLRLAASVALVVCNAACAPTETSVGGNEGVGDDNVAEGPCSLRAGALVPDPLEVSDVFDFDGHIVEVTESPSPDPLRAKWGLDVSSIRFDVYPRALMLTTVADFMQLFEVYLGTCKLRLTGEVSKPDPDASGVLIEGVSYEARTTDSDWSTFHFVPGARYVFEGRVEGTPVFRVQFTRPAPRVQLTSATREKLSWNPFPPPGHEVKAEALRIDESGALETGSSTFLTDTMAGEATWNVTDPSSNYVRVSAGPYGININDVQSPAEGHHQATIQEFWYHEIN